MRLHMTLVLLALLGSPLIAQTPIRIIAFGDSITTGLGDAGVVCPFSETGGYTDRLRQRLEARGVEVEVANFGICGEQTTESVSRVDAVLATGGDVFILMEGTNDLNDVSDPIGIPAIRFNLNEIARKARDAGFVVLRASVIPRREDCGGNDAPSELASAIRNDAAFVGDFFADAFNGLINVPNLFTTFYFDAWHPLPDGYEMLTDIFDFPAYAAVQRAILDNGGDCLLPPGDARFCTICSPCQEGQGDCDGDADCAAGLTCKNNAGPDFGFGGGIDVCVAATNGPVDPPTDPPTNPPPGCTLGPGDPRLCTDCGPCTEGQGDCDLDSECAEGLVCTDNVGAQFGFAPGIDVCLAEDGTPPTEPPPPPPDGCALPAGHPRLCTECGPCAGGEGDCDLDSECAGDLVCTDNVGAQFGFAPGIDICLTVDGEVPDTCPHPVGHPRYCTDCGPCVSGQGDCDSDAECVVGLVCADNVGPTFGFGPAIDVCVAP